ncbi:MAG: ferritin-like domain-containing protein [Myxococcota bacterium]
MTLPPPSDVDLAGLPLAGGGHLLVRRALRMLPDGARLRVYGRDATIGLDLRAWARGQGIPVERVVEVAGSPVASTSPLVAVLVRTPAAEGRWRGAERSGDAGPYGVVENPSPSWGLALRGAAVEPGGPSLHFPLATKAEVWTDEAARIYRKAAAAQWDPATLPWDTPLDHPPEVEDAVVQVMTYLVENEMAALLVPARFLAQVHPHFREVLQVLAVQAADEARHIEVFSRRALLARSAPGLSTAGGQASLATLLTEPDFALSTFLLSVLGEGSFLTLLWFLAEHAPDALTRAIARAAAQDEARHVAFGMAHLGAHLDGDPDLRVRLVNAVTRRHQALVGTAGLNEEVHDALLLLAAGGWDHAQLAEGAARVTRLAHDMDEGRQQRLRLLGFDLDEAEAMSSLHTRNFM